MNQEIKAHIEQIKRGEVPQGYKKTKVGIVPSEWELINLSRLFDFKNGINAEKEKYGHGIKLISVSDILSSEPIYYHSIKGSIDIPKKQLYDYSVTYGDIVFQRSSENYEDAGTANVYLDKHNIAAFGGFVIRGKKKSDYNPVYLNNLLKTSAARREVIRRAAGSQHVNIGQEALSQVMVSFASLPEQQKIADILTTQDKVIELKEKLITEKQQQKKWLMQNLLTGKKRLKGFSGKWKKVKLSKCIKETNDKTYKNNQFEVLSVTKNGIVKQSEHFNKQIASENNVGYKILRKNSLVFSTMNLWMGSLDVLKQYEVGIVSPAYKTFEFITQSLDVSFGNYFMKSNYMIWIYNNNSEQGASIVRRNLDLNGLLNTLVPLPPLTEQTAIAEILSTADCEIELLQKGLAKERQKKKALMQLVLTGIVRV